MGRAAVGCAVLERITSAIDARALAIPETEYTVDLLVGIGLDLLAAENNGGRQVFIDGGYEIDAVLIQQLFGLPESLIIGAQRGAAIAADQTGGVETVLPIEACLHQWNAHQRLSAGKKHATGVAQIAILETIVIELGGIIDRHTRYLSVLDLVVIGG